MSNSVSRRSRSLLPNALGFAGREMDDLFDRLFAPETGGQSASWNAPISIWEEEERFHIEVELPGVPDDSIEVTFDKGQLRISATRKQEEVEGRSYLHSERRFGAIERVINIPDTVDADSIVAEFSNGLLNLQLSKKPEILPKKIEISTR